MTAYLLFVDHGGRSGFCRRHIGRPSLESPRMFRAPDVGRLARDRALASRHCYHHNKSCSRLLSAMPYHSGRMIRSVLIELFWGG